MASTSAEAENYWACGASNAEIRNMQRRGNTDDATDADGNVGIGKLSIKGKPSITRQRNSTDEQIQTWKDQNCEKRGQNQNMSAALFVAEKFLGQKVVEEWSDCMKGREGLQCFARRRPPGIGFVASYRGFDRDLSSIGDKDFYFLHGETTLPQYVEHDGNLYIGEKTYPIPRDPNADTSIVLNALEDHRISLSCEVFVSKMSKCNPLPKSI